MAGIDTRDKRGSVLGVRLAAPRLEQNPAASIAQSGRQIAGLIYSGILAATPVQFKAWWAINSNQQIGMTPPQPVSK